MPSNLLDSAALAARLHRSLSRFRNTRATLERDDAMPPAIAIGGHPLWLESEIDAWLLSRSRLNPTPSADAANQQDTATPPADAAAPTKRGRGRPRKIPAVVRAGGVA